MENKNQDALFASQAEPNRSCLLALKQLILQHSNEITATVKYGMPCFCFRGKPLTYLWVDKKSQEPYILFVEGRQINHPKLESGNRARMKIFRVNPKEDLPVLSINELLEKAILLTKK